MAPTRPGRRSSRSTGAGCGSSGARSGVVVGMRSGGGSLSSPPGTIRRGTSRATRLTISSMEPADTVSDFSFTSPCWKCLSVMVTEPPSVVGLTLPMTTSSTRRESATSLKQSGVSCEQPARAAASAKVAWPSTTWAPVRPAARATTWVNRAGPSGAFGMVPEKGRTRTRGSSACATAAPPTRTAVATSPVKVRLPLIVSPGRGPSFLELLDACADRVGVAGAGPQLQVTLERLLRLVPPLLRGVDQTEPAVGRSEARVGGDRLLEAILGGAGLALHEQIGAL